MKSMDVLRPLALGELRLRPGELEIMRRDLGVERSLRARHVSSFAAGTFTPGAQETGSDLSEIPGVLEKRDSLDLSPAHPCGLDREPERGRLGMRCEPRPGRRVHTTLLLFVDHLERIAERRSSLLLDLDDQQPPPSTEDEIQLVAACADVRRQQPIAAEPVVAERAPLPRVHAAS
jgi:hypothetical protein